MGTLRLRWRVVKPPLQRSRLEEQVKIMEDAAELANYLPLSFKTPKEQEYIEFLWDAFETNYTHEIGRAHV